MVYLTKKFVKKYIVKPNSNKVSNALKTLQNLSPFQEKGNDMRDLLQRFESLHVLDVTNARKQSSI